MTPREAGELLTMMKATWSRLAADEVAAQLWVDDLLGLDRDLAYTTFRLLRGGLDRQPTWAEFRGTYKQQVERPRAVKALEVPPRSPEDVARIHQLVHDLKAKLSLRKGAA